MSGNDSRVSRVSRPSSARRRPRCRPSPTGGASTPRSRPRRPAWSGRWPSAAAHVAVSSAHPHPRAAGASGTPDAGAASRGRCTARPPARGRTSRRRVPARPATGRHRHGWRSAGPRSTVSTSRARCGAFSTASSCPPWMASNAPSSADLPPGPAHRSSHRSSAPSTDGLVSATAHSWLPSSCTDASRSRTGSRPPGSPAPAASRTPYGEYGRPRRRSWRPAPPR